MRNYSQKKNTIRTHRIGAMLIFVLMLLTVILAMVVYSVDVAFMQLARTELKAAVDSAAKAAAGELANTNGDKTQAIAAGILAASRNEVAGASLQLVDSDFEFGQAIEQNDGTWDFLENATPYTSVRVTGLKSSGTNSGPVNLFFAPIFGSGTFTPQSISVASQFKQDLVLVIDRSHSMAFDDSGVDWVYPTGVPNRDVNRDGTTNWIDALLTPPHPRNSRWAQLSRAVATFLLEVNRRNVKPDLALVTWASYLGTNTTESILTGGQTYPAMNRDIDLGSNFGTLMSSIRGRGNLYMLGGTNLSAGIDEGVAIIATQGRPDAKKTLIVMTDGLWNTGRDPLEAAQDAVDEGIVIHTITFLDRADQTTMIDVAELTGGRHFHASNAVELDAIFNELARTLPVALTR